MPKLSLARFLALYSNPLVFSTEELEHSSSAAIQLEGWSQLAQCLSLLMSRRKIGFPVGSVNCLHPNSPRIHLSYCTGQQLLSTILIFQLFQDSSCCFPHVPLLLTVTDKHWHVLHSSFSPAVTLLKFHSTHIKPHFLKAFWGSRWCFLPSMCCN